MNSKIFLFVFVMAIFFITNAIAQENSFIDRPNYVALKGSSISHSGFFYGRQLDERWLIGGGGFYYFDSEDGKKRNWLEYGLEIHYSFYRSGGLNFYALTGVGISSDKKDKYTSTIGFQGYVNDDTDWYQYGFGIGLMSTAKNGFTINLDAGILRYRRATNQDKVRTTAGFGLGIAIGYRF